MDERAKEARRIYIREWQRKNKDKVKQNQERYWERKAAKIQNSEGKRNNEKGIINKRSD